MTLTVRFHGTRGSIPVPTVREDAHARLKEVLRAAIAAGLDDPGRVDEFVASGAAGALPTVYGGNTACVEVEAAGGERLVCDLGSGARSLGARVLAMPAARRPREFHVLMSHLHWDHIVGFPFFPPAYVPGVRIDIHGCHAELEAAFRRQHGAPCFPVEFDRLGAEVRFHVIEPDVTREIAGFRVTPRRLPHAGDSYGYRIERDGRRVVYATDAEHKPEVVGPDYPFVGFARGADLLIFDAQYSLAEAVSLKEDWGHSSNVVGVEIAQFAGVGHLCLFHHEPGNSDAALDRILAETRRLEAMSRTGTAVRVSAAYDGMVVEL